VNRYQFFGYWISSRDAAGLIIMITLGIDLSSAKEGTAPCVIEWTKRQAIAKPPVLRCDAPELDRLIEGAGIVELIRLLGGRRRL
jgi:hypothetical protein